MEKSVEVTLKGLHPGLLMHSYPLVPIEAMEKKSAREQAELSAYKNDGHYYLPGTAIQRALVGAASYSKGKNRGSLSRVVAACVFVSPEVNVLNGNPPHIDTRPVVVPATKGRVLRHRYCFEDWKITVNIAYDPDMLTEAQLRRVVDDCGSKVGLLDYRPEKRGPFGRFAVVGWKAS